MSETELDKEAEELDNEELGEPAEQPAEEEAAEEEEQPEPTTEPEPSEPQDEERTKAFGRIDASFKTYGRNVEKQLSDEITDWLYCPLCAAGAVPGYVNRHDLGRIPEEVQANVQTFLGFQREQEYAQNPDTRTCETCGGKTKVKTGATAGDYQLDKCPTCKGYGFTPPPGYVAGSGGGNGHVTDETAAALADLDTPERDNWGEPRILPDGSPNSNFGKMPQFKTVHPKYGVTANLSPEELISG